MGLDVTHGCWHGSYSSFRKFRKILAWEAGIDLDEMHGFSGDRHWCHYNSDPLVVLLNHSDCEGVIPEWQQLPLANRLMEISEEMTRKYFDDGNKTWVIQRAKQFATGLRKAFSLGETVEFH